MKTSIELMKFGLVGSAAASLHVLTVWLLVLVGIPPLAGNVAGFILAFQASYFGHCFITFEGTPAVMSYLRMLFVSSGGFLINEGAFWTLLRFTSLDYRVALFLVVGAVAALTYLSSRWWVFGKGRKLRASSSLDKRNPVTDDENEAERAWYLITKTFWL